MLPGVLGDSFFGVVLEGEGADTLGLDFLGDKVGLGDLDGEDLPVGLLGEVGLDLDGDEDDILMLSMDLGEAGELDLLLENGCNLSRSCESLRVDSFA